MEENTKDYTHFLSKEKRTKYFVHFLGALCMLSIAVFTLFLIGSNALTKKQVEAKIVEKSDPFQNVAVEAKGAIVWDVVSGKQIYAKNPDLPLPLASLTKVMTALTASAELKSSQKVEIKPEYLTPDGDSNLLVGDSWKVDDLRDFTLLTSSNDGAFALAAVAESGVVNGNGQALFIKAMNDTAKKIGLSNSRFFNEHGLDREADRGGAYGSARDMAKLFEYILKNDPEILEATRYKNLTFSSAEKSYNASNTNLVVNQIPGLIASKTGYTDLAGGNLVIAYDAGLNHPIVISILNSSQDGRFSDTLKLIEATQKYISEN